VKEISIFNRRKRLSDSQFPGARILDLTSKGSLPWVRFSPFYPVGSIPVPGWPGLTSASVEGIWQGLKRFEHENHVDLSRFQNTTMRNLKRTSRGRGDKGVPRGAILGHQFGPDGSVLLDYISARRRIYLPAYRWTLQNRLQAEVEEIRSIARSEPVVLLDYETNPDVEDISRPLSHVSLVKRFIEGTWPETESC
jgi:hypothetical protein